MWTGEGESKILYVHTHGVSDPGRCATPFFLAASAAAMEAEVMIYFTMYGPDPAAAARSSTRSARRATAASRCRYFIEQATSLGVRLLVCQPSLDLNDLASTT